MSRLLSGLTKCHSAQLAFSYLVTNWHLPPTGTVSPVGLLVTRGRLDAVCAGVGTGGATGVGAGVGVGVGVGTGVGAGVAVGIGVETGVAAGTGVETGTWVWTGVGITAWVGAAVCVTVTAAPGAFRRNRVQPLSTAASRASVRNRLKIRTVFFTLSS